MNGNTSQVEQPAEQVEGGLPCYKEIIDNMFALIAVMGCMATSLGIALVKGWQPGEGTLNKWLETTKRTAEIATEVEAEARENW